MERRYLTLREIRLVYGVGWRTVKNAVYDRKLKRKKVGRAWRYSVENLERLFGGTAKSLPE